MHELPTPGVHTIEAATSDPARPGRCHRQISPNLDLIELIRGKKVMVGAIDVASDVIETPEEVADTLRRALRFVDADRLYPSTNCGMTPLSRRVAKGKLKALGAGAEILRQELAA